METPQGKSTLHYCDSWHIIFIYQDDENVDENEGAGHGSNLAQYKDIAIPSESEKLLV